MALTRADITDLMAEKVEVQMKVNRAATKMNADAEAIMAQARLDVQAVKDLYQANVQADQDRLKAIDTLLGGAF